MTVTVTSSVSEFVPVASYAVTVYVVVVVGLTDILAVVAPVLHKYVEPPVAVKVVLLPLQIDTSGPAFAVIPDSL